MDRLPFSASGMPGLEFPWPAAPDKGTVTPIAPGLFWARLPLPFRLNHVNVWLLEENDGWTVIDTGCATPELIALWETLLTGPMGGRPVLRVVATHGHVDHIGLSGWMVERFGAEFIGTFAEWSWARMIHLPDVPGSIETHRAYLARHGLDRETVQGLVDSRQRFIDLSTPIPGALTEIRDGAMIRLGNRDWRVIVTRGHSFEHASFYDSRSGILIAGDHLLPKISPVIAVYETAPNANPLADYLDSFSQFADMPAQTLVLPSHGAPYRGVHTRIGQLRQHHRLRLDEMAGFLSETHTALALARAMFPHVEGHDDTGFALGETLAHINYLLSHGIVREARDRQGRSFYTACA